MDVKLNELGYMEIPGVLCDKLGLRAGSEVEISYDHKNIFINSHNPACPLCGTVLGDGAPRLCKSCEEKIVDAYNTDTKQKEGKK